MAVAQFLRYPQARAIKRRIIFHCGPTNSGKTHTAFQQFLSVPRAVYCAPLIMLATEMWLKTIKEVLWGEWCGGQLVSSRDVCLFVCQFVYLQGVDCDLVTGQEKRFASGRLDQPASHVCCTVEMANITPEHPCGSRPLSQPPTYILLLLHIYLLLLLLLLSPSLLCFLTLSDDVAVVDEVQMLSELNRGGAWTRAILGLPVRELHLCGEPSAVLLIRRMLADLGEELEVTALHTTHHVDSPPLPPG